MTLRQWLRFAPVFWRCVRTLPGGHLLYMARQLRHENPQTHNGRTHINAFFPPYPSPAFDRFLDAVIHRRRVPFSTYFAVTDACPYACPHCSYGRHIGGTLSTPNALEVIRQIQSAGTVTIGFTGGEPLVREDIVELVKAVGGGAASVIFSTGYNLTAALAGQLCAAGLDCMTLGIESDSAEEHDGVRGVKGSFDTTVSAIATSLEAGLYTAISTVGTREKFRNGTLERLAELAASYGVHEFRILEPVPTGRYADQTAAILTAEESAQLAAFHRRWNRRGNGPAIACFAHLESDAMFGCGAGFHHLFIDAVGNVCPCDLTPLAFGNVLQEPLSDIWRRMAEWFELPRCGCLVKRVCRESDALQKAAEFPLCREASERLCRQLEHDGRLPGVFARLFRGRTPTNPPAIRP